MGAGRIQYNSINVDFERGWNNFDYKKYDDKTVNKSTAGLSETIEFYNQDIINFARNKLTGTEKTASLRWWEYVRNGSSFKLWRDREFGFNIPFCGKSTLDNDGNSPTFVRAGVANAVDTYTGLVTSIAENTTRFESGKYDTGLLIEGAMTNLLTNTEDFANAAWVKVTTTVTANQITSPDGTLTADKLLTTAPSGGVIQNTTTVIGTDSATFSIWLKSLTGNRSASIVIGNHLGVTKQAEGIFITPEWQRFTVTYINAGADGNFWNVALLIVDDAATVYAWGAQLETNKFRTSYIANAGTRNVESCYYTLSSNNFDWKTFSISFWIKTTWAYDIGIYRWIIYIADGADYTFAFGINDSNQYYLIYKLIDDSTTVSLATSASSWSANTWTHFVITVDLTTTNGLKLYENGALVATSSNNAGIPSLRTRLYIGSDNAANYQINGLINDIEIYKKVLNATEISAIYNRGFSQGMTRNYFSACKVINTTFEPIQRVGQNRWDFEGECEEILS